MRRALIEIKVIMISEEVKQEGEKTEMDVISLREGGREFHNWIVERKKNFEHEEVRQNMSQ